MIFGDQKEAGKKKYIPVKRVIDYIPCTHWLKYNKKRDSYTCRKGCLFEVTSNSVEKRLILEDDICEEERKEIEKETRLPFDHNFYYI